MWVVGWNIKKAQAFGLATELASKVSSSSVFLSDGTNPLTQSRKIKIKSAVMLVYSLPAANVVLLFLHLPMNCNRSIDRSKVQ